MRIRALFKPLFGALGLFAALFFGVAASAAEAGGEQTDLTDSPGSVATTTQSDQRPQTLSEVVVTAEKRTERLQDVPVPVTAISADALVESNQFRLQDYYTNSPGLTVTPADLNGAPTLAIRGITTGAYTNPTVGVVVDDIPYGASTNLGGGAVIPEVDPSDLQRVEVLRGPQGTLYGASSIGGLLKFVTVDPSTESVSGRIQGDLSGVQNGNDIGYGVRGAVNLPISDTIAIRASGFSRRDPGYIDDPTLNEKGVNWGEADGGRISALWKPSADFTLKLSALLQHTITHGSPDVDVEPGLSDLQQSDVRGTGGYDRQYQIYTAILTARLGAVDLTSLSGYSINKLSDSFDATNTYSQYTDAIFGVPGTALVEKNKTTKFTQEIRLSSSLGQSVDWLLGGFYTHENSPYADQYQALDTLTGAFVGSPGSFDWISTYAEYAAFADLTFHITNRFDVQVGGRESQNKQSYTETDSGDFVPLFYGGTPSPVVFPEVSTKDNAFTYLLTPKFKMSDDAMLYARLASGYRPGGPNSEATIFGLPSTYSPDRTQNYEIGVKADAFNHTVSFDASIYHIDWKNIQLTLVNPTNGLGYFANGSRAKSQGVELGVESKPLAGLTLSGWVEWNDAVLTESLPAASSAVGFAGDRLPYSSRFSGNFSLEDDFPLTSSAVGFVGGAVSYVGAREGVFPSIYSQPPERQPFPAYAKTDLRAGIRFATWTANLFANNVANRRGVLTGGLGTPNPLAFDYIQPRTVGLSVSKKF